MANSQGTPDQAATSKRGIVLRAIGVGFAAVCVLALSQITFLLFDSVRLQVGLHPERPVFAAIADSCGGDRFVLPALSAADDWSDPAELRVCPGPVDLAVLAPPNKTLLVTVNEQLARSVETWEGVTVLRDVELRRGLNVIRVSTADDEVMFPYLARGNRALEPLPSWYRSTPVFGFDVSITPLTADALLVVSTDPPTSKIGRASQPIVVHGAWDLGDERFLLFGSGFPDHFGTDRHLTWPGKGGPGTDGQSNYYLSVESDGSYFDVVDRDAVVDVTAERYPFQRELRITRLEDSGLHLRADLVVPATHPLAVWAAGGQLSSPDLMRAAFGAIAVHRGRAGDQRWLQLGRARVVEAADPGMRRIEAELLVPDARFTIGARNTFPFLPGDRLELVDMAQDVVVHSGPLGRAEENRLIWEGSEATARLQAPDLFVTERRQRERTASEAPPSPAPTLSLAGSLARVRAVLPRLARDLAAAVLRAMPFVLALYALSRMRIRQRDPAIVDGAIAGLLALLVLFLTIGLQPVFSALYRWFVEATGMDRLLQSPEISGTMAGSLYSPLAIAAVILIQPLLRDLRASAFTGGAHGTGTREGIIVAPLSLFMVAAGVALLVLEHNVAGLIREVGSAREVAAGLGFDDLPADLLGLVSVGMVLAPLVAWMVFGLLLFWLPLHWLFRTLLGHPVPWRPVLVASWLMLLLPLAQPLLALLERGVHTIPGLQYGMLRWIGTALAWSADFGWPLVLWLLVWRLIGAISATLLPTVRGEPPPYPRWLIALVSLVVVLPAFVGQVPTGTFGEEALLELLAGVHRLLPVIALFVVLPLFRLIGNRFDARRPTAGFRHDGGIWLLGATVFASFPAMPSTDPLTLALVFVTGWLAFTRLMIVEPATFLQRIRAHAAPTAAGAYTRLIAYRDRMTLLGARHTSMRKTFAEGQRNSNEQATEEAQIALSMTGARRALGTGEDDAKRLVLELGPELTPWRNGLRGARFGLIFALIAELLFRIEIPLGEAAEGDLLGRALLALATDPHLTVIDAFRVSYPLLDLLAALVSIVALWVIAGFLFGFFFHRIRGGDGFVKAMVFFVALSLPLLLTGAVDPRETLSLSFVFRLLPLFVFTLVLGVLIFDFVTVRRAGGNFSGLAKVYGVPASFGYASAVALVLGVQPVLQLLDMLFGS